MSLYLSLPGMPKGSGLYDPLASGGKFDSSSSLMDILGQAVPYVLGFAGLILFLLIIAAGFQIFTAAGNAEKVKKGQGMLFSALIGFAVIFMAYWLMQLLQIVFGIQLGFGA